MSSSIVSEGLPLPRFPSPVHRTCAAKCVGRRRRWVWLRTLDKPGRLRSSEVEIQAEQSSGASPSTWKE
ncbi:hypothetical protein GRJ2_001940000 [Grus japonensis]|uniref:Uncharacterized protein n=1 Tax=Grus japonensis TaxID=30415 RepID=A0ABC9XBE2_GRUJA